MREFLGMERVDETTWRFRVTDRLITPGKFLFGGCGLAAGVVALEEASGRPTIYAAAHYLSFAPLDSEVTSKVDLAVVGHRVTQARATATVERSRGADRERRARHGRTHRAHSVAHDARRAPRPRSVAERVMPRAYDTLHLRSRRDAHRARASLRRARRHARLARVRALGPSAQSPRALGRDTRHLRRLRRWRRTQPSAEAPWAAASTTRFASPRWYRPSGSSSKSTCTRSPADSLKAPDTSGVETGYCSAPLVSRCRRSTWDPPATVECLERWCRLVPLRGYSSVG